MRSFQATAPFKALRSHRSNALRYYRRRIETLQFTNDFFATAVKTGDAPAVGVLLRDPRITPDRFVIEHATKLNHVGVVRFLLEDRRVDPSLNEPLISASNHGFLEIVRELLADGRVHPSTFYNSAIIGASRNGHTEIVRELLADPRITGLSDLRGFGDLALTNACENGHLDVVRMLLASHRFNPSPTPLRTACKNGHVEVVRVTTLVLKSMQTHLTQLALTHQHPIKREMNLQQPHMLKLFACYLQTLVRIHLII